MTIVIIIVLLIASLVAFNLYQSRQQEKKQLRHAQQIVAQHAEELTVKRKQLTIKMNYGLVDTSRWLQEIVFFVKHVVSPEVGEFRGENLRSVYEAIESSTSHFDALTPQLRPGMDGVEYERFVADLLSSLGWETRLTKGSGDQGVDVIAQKQGVKAVVQCKLYSHPVGNDAVQEVIAGRTFENASLAAVVTNATFTSAARQLASAAHVLLLHHDEVGELDVAAGTTPVPPANETPANAQTSSVIPHAGDDTSREGTQPNKAVIRAIGSGVMAILITAIVVFVVWKYHGRGPGVTAAEAGTTAVMATTTATKSLTKPVHRDRARRAVAAQAQPVQTAAAASSTSGAAVGASQSASDQLSEAGPSALSSPPSDSGAAAVTPVSPAAYQRCMEFLRSQGRPESNPGEFSGACSQERQ